MPHPELTETERDIIANAAGPIDPSHRDAFLEAVANALAPHPVLGEGLVHRVCRDLRFLDLPRLPRQLRRGNASRAWRA